MSMTDTSTPAAGTPAGDGPATAPTPPGQPPVPATVADAITSASAPDPDPFTDLPEQPVFDRGYVDKIRREGQRYRETARTAEAELATYADVFAGYDQADRDVWLDLAATWKADPEAAAQKMQHIVQAVLGSEPDPTVAPAAAQQMDEPTDLDLLSPEKVEQLVNDRVQAALDARDRAAAEQAALDGVYAELRQAGVDPSTREGFMVLWTANHETNGDIAAAIDSVRGWKQTIVDDFVKGRQTGALPAPAQGVVASEPQTINNVEDARRATEAFLRSRAGSIPGE
jgi:hypothetical protein